MLDESGSVRAQDWEREKDFVNQLVNGFQNYGPAGVQFGVISYSTGADLDIKLNQYSRKQDFISAIGRIKQYRE